MLSSLVAFVPAWALLASALPSNFDNLSTRDDGIRSRGKKLGINCRGSHFWCGSSPIHGGDNNVKNGEITVNYVSKQQPQGANASMFDGPMLDAPAMDDSTFDALILDEELRKMSPRDEAPESAGALFAPVDSDAEEPGAGVGPRDAATG
ncbi:hypothetical protein CC86DRAFT_431531 [Ophiobolus disseminans]|uniref:Uncharacterized protein n=1 Tax=Ophiobolus disseminans TaxID=1469910 RepID=A0A6A7AGD2_9PLEO|nr:hypothetical protein CC86DRAFT_431531 [Ophiobolus disseminans]